MPSDANKRAVPRGVNAGVSCAFETRRVESSACDGVEGLTRRCACPSPHQAPSRSAPALHPGAIGGGGQGSGTAATGAAVGKGKDAASSKDIWEPHEIPDIVEDDIDDGRMAPGYEFLYKQAVAPEDVYLGLSDKDPSSTQCEDLVLRLDLKGTKSMSGAPRRLCAAHAKPAQRVARDAFPTREGS